MTSVILVDVNGNSRKVNLGHEIASGGAGTVYPVDGEASTVVKQYHTETLKNAGKIYSEKIRCMLQSVPSLASSTSGIVHLAWPFAEARDMSGNFIGFAMPLLDFKSTVGLEFLLQPKQATQKLKKSDLGIRITVAANLAGVVSTIHDKGHQIVDLKPPNLRFYRNGLNVAVLDCDGFQIQIPGRNLPAPQVTPDYLAPEFQYKEVTNPEHQDRFALGVIIFKLLNFGIHPYQGKAKDQNAPTDMQGKISQGMYGYAITPHRMIEPLLVSAHHYFPEELRRLFDRAFGSFVEKRPTPHEWAEALKKYAQPKNALLKQCSDGDMWFSGQPCGACHRNLVLAEKEGATATKVTATPRPWAQPKAQAASPSKTSSKGGAVSAPPQAPHQTQAWIQVRAEAEANVQAKVQALALAQAEVLVLADALAQAEVAAKALALTQFLDQAQAWLQGRTALEIYVHAALQAQAKDEAEANVQAKVQALAEAQAEVLVLAEALAEAQAEDLALAKAQAQGAAPPNTKAKSQRGKTLLGITIVCVAFLGIAYLSHFFSYKALAWISAGIGLVVITRNIKPIKHAIPMAVMLVVLFSAGKYSWDWAFPDVSMLLWLNKLVH